VSAGLVMINGSVLNNVASIAASRELSLALTKDGEVKAWGNNRLSQLDIPHDVTNICAVSAGDGFCLAIKKD
jgi:alpha-tubulin suppressor-like RCC1 family protein